MTKLLQKHFSLFLLGLLFTFQVSGQLDTSESRFEKPEPDLDYENTIKAGGFVHTNGWGIGVQYAKHKSRSVSTLYSFDYLFALKHPKEVKKAKQRFEQANPYVFGRKYALMVARLGWGKQFRIAEKDDDLGVRVDFNFTLGPNLGILKPTHIEVLRENNAGETVREIERYEPKGRHRDQGKIYGGASYLRGLGDLRGVPGASGKASLSFAWDDFKSIETGVMVDAFPRKMPIFAFDENKELFINLYVNFSFGKHW